MAATLLAVEAIGKEVLDQVIGSWHDDGMTKQPNPHIIALVDAHNELDHVLARAAAFEATQERLGTGSQAEALRLEISSRISTLLHNLTLGTPDHEKYRIVR